MRRSQGRCLTPTTRLQLYTALGDARLLPIGGRQAKKLPAVDQTPHRRAQTPLHSPLATPLGGLSTPFATRRLVARRLVACHETSEGSARLILPLLPSLLACNPGPPFLYSSPIPSLRALPCLVPLLRPFPRRPARRHAPPPLPRAAPPLYRPSSHFRRGASMWRRRGASSAVRRSTHR